MSSERTTREVLESLDSRLSDVENDMADSAASQEEISKNLLCLPDILNALRAMSNEVMHLRADLNRLITSEAEQNTGIRKRLKALEDKTNA